MQTTIASTSGDRHKSIEFPSYKVLFAAIISFAAIFGFAKTRVVQSPNVPSGYGWHQLANTVMTSVCLGNVSNGMYTDPSMTTTTNYNFSCNNIVPWGGGAGDDVNQQLIIWGGGHSDYAGDEVFVLKLNGTPTWQRFTNPTYPVPYIWDGNPWEGLKPYYVKLGAGGVYQPGASPSSRHTYNGLQYVPYQNHMYSFGGGVANLGGFSPEVWTLDMGTGVWTMVGPPFSKSPGYPTTAYNPSNGHIVMHDKNFDLLDFDPHTDQWTTLTDQYTVRDGTTAAVDPVNNLLVVLGAGAAYPTVPDYQTIQVFSLSAPYTMQSWAPTNCDLVYRNAGLAWDSALGLMVGYPGGGNQVFFLNTGPNPVVTAFGTVPSHQCLDVPISQNPTPVRGVDYPQDPEGTPAGQNYGIYGRFAYFPSLDTFALVNDRTKNAWSLQLTGGSPAPSFAVSTSPGVVTVPEGSQGTSVITTTVSGGFSNPISFSAAGVPASTTVSFTPSTIAAPGAGSSTMTINVGASTPAGTYPILVSAFGGGDTVNTSVTLTVTAAGLPNFTISAAPSSLSIAQGSQAEPAITTTISGGFNSSISLSASGVPAGTTVSFSPNTIPAPGAGNSTMIIAVGSSTPTGTYPITVTGNGGGVQQNTAVTLTVTTGLPSFTISASPASLSIPQGNQGISTITTALSGGFNGAISLSSSGVPAGTTVSFNPQTIPAPGASNSTMTITVGSSTPTGTYPITVTGNGGGVQQKTTLSLTVTANPSTFTISALPASLSLPQGNLAISTITTALSGSFNSAISLSSSGVPAGTTVSFNPQTIPAPGAGNATMTITVGSSTPTGTYPITVTGNGGGIQQNTTVSLTVTAQGSNYDIGIDFRSTQNYVTDPAYAVFDNCVNDGITQQTRTNLNGQSVSWQWSQKCNGATNESTSVDPRLAGIANVYTASGGETLTITIPQAGTYNVGFATGNAGGGQCGGGQCPNFIFKDGTSGTQLFTVNPNNPGTGHFIDATNHNWTAAQWPSSNQEQPVTLTGTTLTVSMAAGNAPNIGHFRITSTQQTSNFTISASPASLSVAQGNQGSSTVTTTISSGFNSAISLSASGMPTGTTVSFNPQTIPAPGAGNPTMTINVGSSTPTGTYPITVTGNGGGFQQNTTVTLTVFAQGQQNFSISASPASVSIAQGNQGTSTITTAISGGFNSSVSLSASGVPSGTTVSFNPQTIPAPGAGGSSMTITVGSSTPTGTYPITVSGNGGGVQQNAVVTLTVTAAVQPDFVLTVSPSAVFVPQGLGGNATVTAWLVGSFNSPISLSASGVPAGTTVSLSPSTIPAPGAGNSTMTLAVGSSTPTGSYPITVTGIGGGTQHTVTLYLVVTQGGFTPSASPASINVAQGKQGTSTITTALSLGFNSPIRLSASGTPAGTTVNFNPGTISAPSGGTSTMTITVGSSTPVGTYPITVTGNGGGTEQSTIVSLTVTGSAYDVGIDFRGTQNYVTDPPYAVFDNCLNDGTNQQTRTNANGYSVTWQWSQKCNAATNENGSVDPRLAGIASVYTASGGETLTITVPQAGTYNVGFATGNAAGNQCGGGACPNFIFKDGASGTQLFTVNPNNPGIGHFIDAASHNWTAAQWPASNQEQRSR